MKHLASLALAVAAFALGVTLGACSDDPADLAGEYSANLTARDNGCNLAGWTAGNTATAIPVTITQTGSTASADIGGISRIALDLALGGHIFTGDVDISSFELKLVGTQALMNGNCAYTLNAELDGKLNGDSISGRLNFTAKTNGNPDCAVLETCVSYQEFTGSRPPR